MRDVAKPFDVNDPWHCQFAGPGWCQECLTLFKGELSCMTRLCRKNISGPAFLINHPLLVAPLAKPNTDGKTAQVFQPIFAGSEIGRGYSELNDSRIQRANFEQQQNLLDSGDDEAMMPDFEFVEMLEHGMPPTCGYGFGDRLFAFLAGLPIRETQMFPLVKPIIK